MPALDLVAAVVGARRGGRRDRAARAGRRPDRRGGGDARRRGRGDGRRRPRQHRLARPVGGGAGERLVGESTRRATEQAVVYEDAGSVRAEGQGGPDPALEGAPRRLGRARDAASRRASRRRSSAATGSCARSRTCSTPAPTRSRRSSCSVTGIAGIGKSRLAWEFYKYFDGLAQLVYWHRGPLPRLRRGRHVLGARGHGADALPDRRGRDRRSRRCRSCGRRSRSTCSTPTSGGSSSRGSRSCSAWASTRPRDRQDLFAAWRLFFERLADDVSDVLAFEDMQWADASLLDFVEYLLDWSRNHPIYVITLARPELAERRPTWGAGQRNFTSLYLEPLSARGDGGAARRPRPGPAGEPARQILERAEGVPLYAVETVRMLLDRGAARPGGVGLPAGRDDRAARRCRRRCTR